MECEVRCFAGLSPKNITKNIFTFKEPMTVLQVMEEIDINPQDVRLIFINGVHGETHSIVQENDRVAFFPPIGGG